MQHWLPKISTNHHGTLPGSTVHFDWLKSLKAVTPALPKNLLFNLQINQQNTVNGLGLKHKKIRNPSFGSK
jgi:hypothetical protein